MTVRRNPPYVDGRLETAGVLAKVAVVAGVCGLLATVPFSSPLQALLLLVFLLAGPGSAAMCWVDFPPGVTVAAVVGLSISCVLAVSSAMAWLGAWGAVVSCLVLSSITIASAAIRLRVLRVLGPHTTRSEVGQW